jgi:hypothetical protein
VQLLTDSSTGTLGQPAYDVPSGGATPALASDVAELHVEVAELRDKVAKLCDDVEARACPPPATRARWCERSTAGARSPGRGSSLVPVDGLSMEVGAWHESWS